MKTCGNCGSQGNSECGISCSINNPIKWSPRAICSACQRKNCDGSLCLHDEWLIPKGENVLSFQRLNGLKPTMTSCRDKLFEEIGEYLRLTGKGMKASGEQGEAFATPLEMIKELADVAQSASTQIYFLAEEHGINLNEVMAEHEKKLIEKKYLLLGGDFNV